MDWILELDGLAKTYRGGVHALAGVDLKVKRGEIFALLGPNGAGKTTLIGAVCGLVRPTGGTMRAFGLDLARDWRKARARIGLVPQEMGFDIFDTVLRSVQHSRGLFGYPPDAAHLEDILRSLSLWDKRNAQIRELSGGMKRRVLIAKALSHDPELLFLDEPTAGVDVELRRDMWRMIDRLRERGTTIILTTHYIEEAEEMADRIGVIQSGRLLVVEQKHALMARMGSVEALFRLARPLASVPESLGVFPLTLEEHGHRLRYRGIASESEGQVAALVQALAAQQIIFTGLDIHQSSLEDIFVDLVENAR